MEAKVKTNQILAAAFAAIAFNVASACNADEIHINVLPFDVQTDFDHTYKQLQEIGVNGGEVGLVKTNAFVRVDGCTATVGWKAPVLYVASELQRDQCAFNHVLEHEQEHVRIYQQAAATLEDRVRASARVKPLFEASVDAVTAVRAAHAAHDSDEEYSRNATACNGQVARLIKKSRLL